MVACVRHRIVGLLEKQHFSLSPLQLSRFQGCALSLLAQYAGRSVLSLHPRPDYVARIFIPIATWSAVAAVSKN